MSDVGITFHVAAKNLRENVAALKAASTTIDELAKQRRPENPYPPETPAHDMLEFRVACANLARALGAAVQRDVDRLKTMAQDLGRR